MNRIAIVFLTVAVISAQNAFSVYWTGGEKFFGYDGVCRNSEGEYMNSRQVEGDDIDSLQTCAQRCNGVL